MQPVSETEPFTLILFGATGDLSLRKLLPALYRRERHRQLPAAARIICLGRQRIGRQEFLHRVEHSLRLQLPTGVFQQADWEVFGQRLEFLPLDAHQPEDYRRLAQHLDAGEPATETVATRIFYLSTAPSLFVVIVQNLAQAGLNGPDTRVVLEKPLGHDLASARHISAAVGRVFAEHQTFRIDHYLGKETVQNLLALRFGNAFFDPLWRRNWVSNVQITLAEQVGVEGRGEFYDQTGALRDMVQNHLLQLLCIIALEPPTSLDPDAIRDEKLKILRALRPIEGQSVVGRTVRGRYTAGAIRGQPVPGYLEEPGIAQDSRTETFVALKAEIGTWRWAGVPFYLRTGKRLQERLAEIVVNFQPVPHCIFDTDGGCMDVNRLVIRLQPQEGVRLQLMAKQPGDGMRLRPVHLDLSFAESFRTEQSDAYERLLMDVIRGRLTLFMRRDELEAAWRWIDPILAGWQQREMQPKPYVAGTWGPAASSALISRDGFAWHEEN